MDEAWAEMKQSISLANRLNKNEDEVSEFHAELQSALRSAVSRCRVERKRKLAEAPQLDLSDECMRRAARFTDNLPLADYAKILHLVPRLVNVVTVSIRTQTLLSHTRRQNTVPLIAQLAEAVPVPGSGITLPLDLHAIGARCTNAYYAPRRFAAVQLAFSNPRCRVLIFHTGRLVGTGCSGPMQARMAILKAARQLAVEAKVFVHIRKFSVINQVGAVGIDAKLNCDAFASTHSATSHYDRASFVGLAWRPGGEQICCEIYSTGKANLPGSTRQRDLLSSFARMVSELLRHSNRPEVCELVPEHLRLCHRPRQVTRDDAPVIARSKAKAAAKPSARVEDLFVDDSDWHLEPLAAVGGLTDEDAVDGEELLALAGF
jgi:TATA-box binding protein (TBP) (component of TFIID and TFIIIB)